MKGFVFAYQAGVSNMLALRFADAIAIVKPSSRFFRRMPIANALIYVYHHNSELRVIYFHMTGDSTPVFLYIHPDWRYWEEFKISYLQELLLPYYQAARGNTAEHNKP